MVIQHRYDAFKDNLAGIYWDEIKIFTEIRGKVSSLVRWGELGRAWRVLEMLEIFMEFWSREVEKEVWVSWDVALGSQAVDRNVDWQQVYM